MMKFTTHCLLPLIAIVFSHASTADTTNNIAVEKVSANLHVLKDINYETNIGVFKTNDGLVLIDPMPGNTQLDKLNAVIGSLYQSPIKYILNTHAHEDHTGGNAFFAQKGATLIESSAKLAGIEQITVNSHTSNDTVYFVKESNSLFVGDVFDTSWHPTFYSGGLSGFNAAIDKILALGDEDSLVIPGHGEPSDKAMLRRFRDNTIAWYKHVSVLHSKGMSVDDIMTDAKVLEILNTFNVKNRPAFLPKRAFKRFIERTVTLIEKG